MTLGLPQKWQAVANWCLLFVVAALASLEPSISERAFAQNPAPLALTTFGQTATPDMMQALASPTSRPTVTVQIATSNQASTPGGKSWFDSAQFLSAIIGGAFVLFGTVVANWLQYRSQLREFKRERLKERFVEVEHYLCACLEFLDLVTQYRDRASEFGSTFLYPDSVQHEEWAVAMGRQRESWASLPARGSARMLLVPDAEVRRKMEEIERLRSSIYSTVEQYDKRTWSVIFGQEWCDDVARMRATTTEVQSRLEELLSHV